MASEIVETDGNKITTYFAENKSLGLKVWSDIFNTSTNEAMVNVKKESVIYTTFLVHTAHFLEIEIDLYNIFQKFLFDVTTLTDSKCRYKTNFAVNFKGNGVVKKTKSVKLTSVPDFFIDFAFDCDGSRVFSVCKKKDNSKLYEIVVNGKNKFDIKQYVNSSIFE